MIRESAPAKVNLVLHVGPRRDDGLHELCSLFASVELADTVTIDEVSQGADHVACRGVEGPNIVESALEAFRAAGPRAELPPLRVEIEKRIPVAAGLGGGSADAAATLRAANELTGRPLDAADLRAVAARVGADVPSQVEPRHALVGGAGEEVEPISLPPMGILLVPAEDGLATAAVYAEADRIGATRATLHLDVVRALAALPLDEFAAAMDNDLEAAAVSLRPELRVTIAEVRASGALTALVTGSGPTVFGVFETLDEARKSASLFPGSIATTLRDS
jgi:4-diphosphocytidyl-2-C-methyl-D-erythritol kinase